MVEDARWVYWRSVYHAVEGKLIVANTLVLRSRKPVTGPVVSKTMELLMKKHPMLRMCTKKGQTGDKKGQRYVLQFVLEILCLMPGISEFMMSRMYGGNAFTRKHGVEIQRHRLQIQLRTRMIPVEFTKVETSSLLRVCKEHQTTVQGAVQTAAGSAMVTMHEMDEYEAESKCHRQSISNIRPFLKSIVYPMTMLEHIFHYCKVKT